MEACRNGGASAEMKCSGGSWWGCSEHSGKRKTFEASGGLSTVEEGSVKQDTGLPQTATQSNQETHHGMARTSL